MIHQNTCRYLGRCSWDTGYQPATMIEEGERLGQVMEDKDILFMCHHGTLVSLVSQIQRITVLMHYLFQVVAERAENDYKFYHNNEFRFARRKTTVRIITFYNQSV